MQAPTIFIKQAHFAYPENVIFSQLDLCLPAKQWTGLIGPSGSGKSSLLRMLAGLSKSENIAGQINTSNAIPIQQQIAYMAQNDLLLPWLSVLDNCLIGFKLRQKKSHYLQAKLDQAKALLTQVGLGKVIHHYPHQLSGGMRQRCALVRTLLENKLIILMDEPFSSLDALNRFKMQTLAAELLKDKTVLFVTHDPLEALRLANDIYLLHRKPATLEHIAHLNTSSPRALQAPEIQNIYPTILAKLMQGDEAA